MYHDVLLEAAIEAVKRGTGLNFVVRQREREPQAPTEADAAIHLPDHDIEFRVELKRRTEQLNVGALATQLKQQERLDDTLLVGDYINPALAQRLREARIQFVDTAGNAYINRPPLYVQIHGNKPELVAQTPKSGRAFQQTGMKVILALLMDPTLLNAPYRLIAEKAQVALGNIGRILNDLIAQGFIQEGFTPNTRTLNFDKLLERWVEEYPVKLRAKLTLGTFTTENAQWWTALKPAELGVYWGGELAAYHYTKHLNPRDFIVYIDRNMLAKFLGEARLKRLDPARTDGIRIDVFRQFWLDEANAVHGRLAHPIITYADLIETGNPRNLEAAERLRANYIH